MRSMRLLLWVAVFLSGCTIIRYRDPEAPVQPKEIDVLVLTAVTPGTANLASSYEASLKAIEGALKQQGVLIRKLALAPLYQRFGGETPLLYTRDEAPADNPEGTLNGGDADSFGDADPGTEPDPESGSEEPEPPEPSEPSEPSEPPEPPASITAALLYFASETGRVHLSPGVEAEGANLAELGENLASRPRYWPEASSIGAQAYFGEPGDGFAVIVFSAGSRFCDAQNQACQISGLSQGDFFTRETADVADWLQMSAASGLPAARIVHVFVATAEGVSPEAFRQQCGGLSGLPSGVIDVLEPSPTAYFGPLTDAIVARGGTATMVDMCQALADPGTAADSIALTIVDVIP